MCVWLSCECRYYARQCPHKTAIHRLLHLRLRATVRRKTQAEAAETRELSLVGTACGGVRAFQTKRTGKLETRKCRTTPYCLAIANSRVPYCITCNDLYVLIRQKKWYIDNKERGSTRPIYNGVNKFKLWTACSTKHLAVLHRKLSDVLYIAIAESVKLRVYQCACNLKLKKVIQSAMIDMLFVLSDLIKKRVGLTMRSNDLMSWLPQSPDFGAV